MLYGRYEHTVDAKNRVFVPAKFKEALDNSFKLTYNDFNKCILVYSNREWDKYEEKLAALPTLQFEDYIREIFSNTVDVQIDSQGRIVIPQFLKEKVDAGCDFLTTQMFFDNNILYSFLYKIREFGITVPVIPGIMPVTNPAQIKRICSLSGTILPRRFIQIVDRFGSNPEAMKQAGIAYATEQIVDLYANGIKAVHVYSMNKPEVAARIQSNLEGITG